MSADAEVSMKVRKRDGSLEPVDLNKIVRAVSRQCRGLAHVDPMRVATKTISGIYDGATTVQLDELNVRNAADLSAEEPEYEHLAGRLLADVIEKETKQQGIYSFSQSIEMGVKLELVNDRTRDFVRRHARKLDDAIRNDRSDLFEYFGLKTLYDRYFFRHPKTRRVLETPQFAWMRIAAALSDTVSEALERYELMSLLRCLPSSPTLFNAGARTEQLSSCFLLDSPEDSLAGIYARQTEIAFLSKYAGGIGVAYSRVRSQGSHIKGTNGPSNGIVPWLKMLDASVAAVNQGGKRKGACAVYLEPWHADVEDFLELRENTGDVSRRTYNLNTVNWIPDLFMRRVESDADWSLFDPKEVPEFVDLWGEDFDRAYEAAESAGIAKRTIKARDLYSRMMKSLAQTGNGWMCFKDRANAMCNQTLNRENVVHLSNLCVEIVEVSNNDECAVCNLSSLNLAQHMLEHGEIDWLTLAKTVRTAVRQLDTVIDRNYYTIEPTRRSNKRWRSIGLGLMGFQDVLFARGLPFDSAESMALSRQLSEHIYFHALSASMELAKERGSFPSFHESRTRDGVLQFDLWGVDPSESYAWDALKKDIREHGLRNSLVVALAPTATIASIAGCYECIEPQVSNLFKRETMSGDFLQVNRSVVERLRGLGLWNEQTRNAIKLAEGSIQNIEGFPEDLKKIYRTAWEIPQRALIDLQAMRAPFIDQSTSLNLFLEEPTIGKLSSMYMHAWKCGLKTTYYLRSRPATKIAKATIAAVEKPKVSDSEVIACSLENPETCEVCS